MSIVNIRDLRIPSVREIELWKLRFTIATFMAIVSCSISIGLAFYLMYKPLIAISLFLVGILSVKGFLFFSESASGYVETPTDVYQMLKSSTSNELSNENVKAYLGAVKLSGRNYLISKEVREIVSYVQQENNTLKLQEARESIFTREATNDDSSVNSNNKVEK